MTTPIRHAASAPVNGHSTPVPQRGSAVSSPSTNYPFLLPPINPDEIGRLGNFRVLRLLGKGGMGYVFLAEDLALGRPVALKVMRPDLDRDACGWRRFLREARAMVSIKHESLVTVYQVGQEQEVVYLAMELLEGESLDHWLRRVQRPELADILRVGRAIASGLAAIHGRGLIHRDIKPANLWREEPSGRVKILDFGLARFIDDDASLTQTGEVLGTPCFMSPEQARGETVDLRSDLFSFGCVLYTLCTGTSPFHANNSTAVLTHLALRDPKPVHQINPAIPRALSDLVTQLLEKKPEDRPESAEAVLERLQLVEEQPPDLPPTPDRIDASRGDDTWAPPRRKKRRARRQTGRPWPKLLLALVLVAGVGVVVAAIALLVFRSDGPGAAAAHNRGAGRVFLSTLDLFQQDHWPMQPPPNPGKPPIKPIGDVSVQGKESPHGIFMHPPPPWEGSASLTYRLSGNFRTFHAEVSLNDGPPRSEVPVTFAVYGDGQLLWKSRAVRTQGDTQTCAVAVQGVDRLKIEVSCTGEPFGAHAVWIEPSLAR
jgi:serine/threonine protein kinase